MLWQKIISTKASQMLMKLFSGVNLNKQQAAF